MKFRTISAIAACAASVAYAPGAFAAVTVLGDGLAHSCFEYAELGGTARDGITTCTIALEQQALPPKDRAATFINRGILKARVDNAPGALDDYNQGLSIDGDLGEGYVDRGATKIVLKRYDEALDDLDRGISLAANRVQIAYYDRAIVDEALGNIRAAYEDYKKAAEIQPDFTLATEQLARFKIVRKHTDGT
jgi:tetratricopeptide (TPR) repeat protein